MEFLAGVVVGAFCVTAINWLADYVIARYFGERE